MTRDHIQMILMDIDSPGVDFYLGTTNGLDMFLQVVGREIDVETRLEAEMKGRKWLLSEHMVTTEIVHTALKAVLAYHEHEIREKFRYRGEAIFNPHMSVHQLVEWCKHPEHQEVR